MNYDLMDNKEIEKALKIKPVDKNRLQYFHSYEHDDLDNWEEVEKLLKELKEMGISSYHCTVTVLGYEIIMDHYIRVYYRTHISNS
ncbi:hypothetical protein [Bacillus sp. Brlt_9]|uniref:hypothetical protein n=1 Tax=Bacillus sp. Brlt_9 TaxID=3110916 RepID=UPI003F7B4B73